MELVSKLRWIIITFVLLVALVLVGWGLSSIARNIFSSIGESSNKVVVDDNISLDDIKYLRFTADGPVISAQEHRRYVVEVTPELVKFTLTSYYGEKQLLKKTYKNTPDAYQNLLYSLDKADATARLSNTTADDDFDEKGACPSGKRYILEMGDSIRRWGTSCSGKLGTSVSKMTVIRSLFTKQIPGFIDLTKDTGLSQQ